MTVSLQFRPQLRGQILLPSSKSISNRVLAINALAGGAYEMMRLAVCDDTDAMLRALRTPTGEVNIGAAGTAMRFATAFFAVTPGTHILTGSERMLQRPIRPLVETLRALGAHIDYLGQEGYPPLRIEGKVLEGGEAEIAATISSQYISALLMVAPMFQKGLQLRLVGELISRPYVDLTLNLMRRFGAKAEWTDAQTLQIFPTGYQSSATFAVEADWSAASYWYALMALTPDAEARVVLPYLEANSLQGDAKAQDFFAPLGVQTTFTDEGVVLTKGKRTPLELYDLDLTEQPDLAQTLVVVATMLDQPFRFSGLQTLRIKETDRIAALQAETAKLGYLLHEPQAGTLTWQGERQTAQKHPNIATYDDHRMAMAFAPAAYRFPGLQIAHPEVVTKSYPHFWEDIAQLLG